MRTLNVILYLVLLYLYKNSIFSQWWIWALKVWDLDVPLSVPDGCSFSDLKVSGALLRQSDVHWRADNNAIGKLSILIKEEHILYVMYRYMYKEILWKKISKRNWEILIQEKEHK